MNTTFQIDTFFPKEEVEFMNKWATEFILPNIPSTSNSVKTKKNRRMRRWLRHNGGRKTLG